MDEYIDNPVNQPFGVGNYSQSTNYLYSTSPSISPFNLGQGGYSDTFAQDTYAQLVRNEYADYKSRFQPYETKLMSIADSEQLLDQQLAKISGTSERRFSQARTNSALMDRRYGVQQSQRQQNYNTTQSEAQRGLAISQAKNMSRLNAKDRRLGVLSGAGSTRQQAQDLGG